MTDQSLDPDEPATNTVVYRCPTCQQVVAIVPNGFTITAEKLEDRRIEHNNTHRLIKETVKGSE